MLLNNVGVTVLPATETEEAKIVFVATSTDGVAYYKIGLDGEWVLLTLPTE